MFKPELTNIHSETKFQELIQDFLNILGNFKVNLGGIKIISSKELKERDVLKYMYPSLYLGATLGLNSLSKMDKKRLYDIAQENGIIEFEVLGAYQFLEQFKEFSTLALETLCRNVKTYKIGNGMYCINVTINGKNYIIINPFHPYQREWFYDEKNCIIIFECVTLNSFRLIRENCIGNLEPASSPENSLKKTFYEKKYGVEIINVAYNGFHVSPSLVEALRMILFFFLENDIQKCGKTSLGQQLIKLGLNNEEISQIISNICINDEKIFELLEFANNEEIK